jgi:hypothetical protein
MSLLVCAAAEAQDAPAQPEEAPAAAAEDGPDRPEQRQGRGFFSGAYEPAERRMWFLETEINAWYVSPGGDLSIGGSPLAETATLNVDSPQATPMVEAHARLDPFTLSIRGSLLDVDNAAQLPTPTTLGVVTYGAGEIVETNYRLDEAAVRLGYRLFQFDGDPDERGRPLISAGVELLGGLRVFDGSLGVTGASGTVGTSFTHVEPLIGFAADVTFADKYEIQFQNTHAGTPDIDGQRSFTVDIQVTFKYRPVENAAVQLGYRIRQNRLKGDDYEIDGAVAGIFAGLALRF